MISIDTILSRISHLKYIGNAGISVSKPVEADPGNTDPNVIMWVSDKNIAMLNRIETGVVICSAKFTGHKPGCNYIISANPRYTFKELVDAFFVPAKVPVVAASARINVSVSLGKDLSIGENVIIEENVIIGDNCRIGHNTVIHANTVIGDHVSIGCNNTIGGTGFGYEKNDDGAFELIPHIGNVIIGDHCDIGNNTCIDRGVLGSTQIGRNVKVDNLVHIAHGVVIGQNSLIIAHAMIGGSTVIGENVWFAPSASVLNKKTIASNSTIGMGAVVVNDVGENETIVGNPGKILNK